MRHTECSECQRGTQTDEPTSELIYGRKNHRRLRRIGLPLSGNNGYAHGQARNVFRVKGGKSNKVYFKDCNRNAKIAPKWRKEKALMQKK